jgi:tetratricopeptide (TPR) repeat protein
MRGGRLLAVSLVGLAACARPPAEAPPVAAAPTRITHEQAVGVLEGARELVERHDYEQAHAQVTAVLGDAERWAWLDVLADGQFLLGEVADRERRPRDAADAYARAYDASRKEGNLERGLRTLNALTNSLLDAGAWGKAHAAAAEASRLAARQGDLPAEATAENNLAEADRLGGRLPEARQSYERALALARQVGDRAATTSILLNLGVTERQAGRLVEARTRFVEAQRLARALADERAAAYAQWHLDQIEAEIRATGGHPAEGANQ